MNQAYIEDRQGRKHGSDPTAHYVARFSGEAKDEYARMQGVDIEEEEPEPIGPVEYPRCGRDTPRHEPVCVWCNQAVSHAGVQSLQEQEQGVRDALFRFAQEKLELIEDFRRAQDFTDLLENNPDLFGDAQEFVQALSKK